MASFGTVLYTVQYSKRLFFISQRLKDRFAFDFYSDDIFPAR